MKNKETYAKAKTLLEKYGETVTPDIRLVSTESKSPGILYGLSTEIIKLIFLRYTDLRQRVTVKPAIPGSPKPPAGPPPNIGRLETFTQQTPDGQPSNQPPGKHIYFIQMINRNSNDKYYLVNTPGKLPRAILPPERTFWESILNFIVGDGPSKR